MKINQKIKNAIFCHFSYGPIFGGGHDFIIHSYSNRKKSKNFKINLINKYFVYLFFIVFFILSDI
jgi:hypothetical protein